MRTLRKAGRVLRLFTAEAPEWTLSEVARAEGISTSGAHDLLDGLVQTGLLSRVDRGRYRLGPFVATLYRVLTDTSRLTAAARPVLSKLVEDHGETAQLLVLDQVRLVQIDGIEGTRSLRVARGLLAQIEPHKSPAGMLHLAVATPARQAAYVAAHAEARTPLLPKERWQAHLEALAGQGFAEGALSTERDISCSAALVRGHSGAAQAVLALTVPTARHEIQPRAFRAVTVAAAARISEALAR